MVGDAETGWREGKLVGKLEGKLVGSPATVVGNEGLFVSPGRVGCDDTTRVGWRVGASSTAVVGLIVAIVGRADGCGVAGAGEGLPLGGIDGASVGGRVVVGLFVMVEGLKVVGGVVGAAVGAKAAPGTVGCGVAG